MKRTIIQIFAAFLGLVLLVFCLCRAINRIRRAEEAVAEANRLREALLAPYTGEAELMRLYGEADLRLFQGTNPSDIDGVERIGNSFILTAETVQGVMRAELWLTAASTGQRCRLTGIGMDD